MHSVIAGDWHACAVQCQYSMKCVPHGRNGVQGFSTTCDMLKTEVVLVHAQAVWNSVQLLCGIPVLI